MISPTTFGGKRGRRVVRLLGMLIRVDTNVKNLPCVYSVHGRLREVLEVEC